MALRPFFEGSELPMLKADSALPQCGACGFARACKSPKLPPAGKGRKKILVVSAFPGEEEDARGKLNVGDSSQVLRQAMGRAGLDLDRDCWLTNAVICRPTNPKSVEAAVDYCRPNLVKTVTELNPQVVVTLGTEAVSSVMGWLWRKGEGGVMRWRGFQIPNRKLNTWVVPTFHPAFLMRERDDVFDKMFLADLRAAGGLKGRPYGKHPPPADLGDQVWNIKNPKEAAGAVKKLHAAARRDGFAVAFDFETNCKKPEGPKARIVSCSFSDGDQNTFAFPWQGSYLGHTVAALLADPKVRKIGANIKFEDRWCRRHVGPVRGWWWDVNLAAHAIDNASKVRNITSVDFQAVARLGVSDWDSHVHHYLTTARSSGGAAVNNIHSLDLTKLLRYNGLDSLYEHLICQHQRKQIGLDPLED
jgi:DNA polymerase